MIPQKDIDLTVIAQERVLTRFWSKVDTFGDCWEWKAGRMRDGYGRFSINGITFPAHRIAYCIYNSADPGALLVCHKCDNPGCVNPSHLFVGAPIDNALDKIEKGRDNPAVGERGSNAAMTDVSAHVARDMYATWKYTCRDIAIHFGVDRITIQRIVTGRTYKTAGGPISRNNKRHTDGERNGRAKLKEQDVRDIRSLFSGGKTVLQISRMLDLHESTVGNVVKRKTWKSVQ